MSTKAVQEFIPAASHTDKKDDEPLPDTVIVVPDWEADLNALASQPGTRVTIPRSAHVKRDQVVSAFQNAFELTGGIPRLALWADQNQTEFYRLYAKLMPKQQDTTISQDQAFVIKHVLPRGPLDE